MDTEQSEKWLGDPLWLPTVSEEVVQRLSTRSRLFVTSLLLCLAVGVTIFCAVQTIRAIQRFQLAHSIPAQADVNAIQPWMTIHYISHAYAVPEVYLTADLHFADTRSIAHVPLRTLAVRYNRPVGAIIGDLQTAIKVYREQNPNHSSSSTRVNTILALERSMT